MSRLDNHLRQTHKAKCDKTFKKLLQDSKEMIVKDSSSKESSEEEKSSSEEESSSDESDYMQFKNIVQRPHTKKYLETVKDVPVDSEDSEDEDWLVSRVKYWANKKQGKILLMIIFPTSSVLVDSSGMALLDRKFSNLQFKSAC